MAKRFHCDDSGEAVDHTPAWSTELVSNKKFRQFEATSNERVRIDNLVLRNCAQMLHYTKCIQNERVGRHFMANRRATYNRRKIALGVSQVKRQGESANLDKFHAPWPIADYKHNFMIPKNMTTRVLVSIFKRFSRFRQFTIHNGDENYSSGLDVRVLDALLTSGCCPTCVDRYEIICGEFETVHCRLIEKLAPFTTSLLLFVDAPFTLGENDRERCKSATAALSRHLWKAVAFCAHLNRLDLRLDISDSDENLFVFAKYLQQCLQTLKIRHFSFFVGPPLWAFEEELIEEYDNSYYDGAYFLHAFERNENLRSLSIGNWFSNDEHGIDVLADSIMHPLISRMREISFDYFNEYFLEFYESDIVHVLQTLSSSSRFSVARDFRRREEDFDTIEEELKQLSDDVCNTLHSWLILSEKTNRIILLYFTFWYKTEQFTDCIEKGIASLLNKTGLLVKRDESRLGRSYRHLRRASTNFRLSIRDLYQFTVAHFGESRKHGNSVVITKY